MTERCIYLVNHELLEKSWGLRLRTTVLYDVLGSMGSLIVVFELQYSLEHTCVYKNFKKIVLNKDTSLLLILLQILCSALKQTFSSCQRHC